VTNSSDCNDSQLQYVDGDSDSFGSTTQTDCGVANSSDCDDDNAIINPLGTEICNGKDDDCDGETDNGLVFHFYYRDADNDTYGKADNATFACAVPDGYVDNLTDDNVTIAFDCKDNDSSVNPGAADAICNGIDNNCDNSTDEGYVDNGTCGVGYCRTSNTPSSCVDGDETACQPGSPSGTAESVCNGVDDNCDGATDEDYDDDESCFKQGVCAAGNVASICQADGTVTACQTGSPSGIAESICNGADDDCDGATDEDYDADESCFKPGVCAAGNVASICQADGTVTACQPGSPSGIAESVCNNADDDCDGQTDEAFVGTQTFCGDGACARTGISTCSGGITGDT
jgi:hypothetical protein